MMLKSIQWFNEKEEGFYTVPDLTIGESLDYDDLEGWLIDDEDVVEELEKSTFPLTVCDFDHELQLCWVYEMECAISYGWLSFDEN